MTSHEVFINDAGRLRSGWRLLAFVFIYLCLLLLLGSVIRIGYVVARQLSPARDFGIFVPDLIFRHLLLASALIAGYVCARWLEGLPWRSLGVTFHERCWRDFFIGSIVGIASLAVAAVIATFAGGLSFTISPRTLWGSVVQTLILSAVLFVCAALAEESLFRGYPLQTLVRARLAIFGVLLTSIAFASIHMSNPNFTQGLPYVNLLLAGVWLSIAYLRTRSLWLPLGIHWSWNWALGSLFGLPVSGISSIAPHPLLHGTDLGPAWLTGGGYGIEGGLAATAALVASTIFIWRTKLVSPAAELLQLTAHENPTARKRVTNSE
ncbi:MAG TPA: type II CAAX endopeptidase family protein [Pyrinomonadaceae bacterium]|nr:type II CAAX endopeptidase family protein [Pyrinomonadaceae bacterium]